MFYVEWYDKELDDIFSSITTEKGLEYLKKHAEIFEIIIEKRVDNFIAF